MKRMLALLFVVSICASAAEAQIARNPKLAKQDLDIAQAQSREAGGPQSELVYAVRLDLVQKGSFDSLVVVYQTRDNKDIHSFVFRDNKRFPLAFDKQGRALRSGDSFYRVGIKHVDSGSPVLRLMGTFFDQSRRELVRNLDFQFDGNAFALVDQSSFPLPK